MRELATAALPTLVAILAGLLAVPAGARQAPPEPSRLVAVPFPDTTELEEAVRDRLAAERERWRSTIEAVGSSEAERADAYGRLGQAFHAYELLEPARAAYENAHRLAPEDPRWTYLSGVVHQQRGALDRAAERFEAAVEAAPRLLPAWVRLGELRLEQGDLEAADGYLTRAAELAPESPGVQAALGQLHLARGEHQEAVELISRALEQVPEANRLHYPLALAYRGLGEIDRARHHLDKRGEVGVTVADPLMDEVEAFTEGERVHLLSGRRAFEAGRYAEAVTAFERAVNAAPDSARARVNLASALSEMGEPSRAAAELEKAIGLEPDNATAHYNLGVLLTRHGRAADALPYLERAVELEPSDGEARLELATALREAGRTEAALEAYREAAGAGADEVRVILGEVETLIRLGRYGAVRDQLEAAHRERPEEGRIAHALARVLAAAPDPSVRDGERAVSLAGVVFEARSTVDHAETLALALAEAGRCAEAAELQRKAVGGAAEGGASAARIGELGDALARYEAGPPCRPPGSAEATGAAD